MANVYINENDQLLLERLKAKLEDNKPIHPQDCGQFKQLITDILNKRQKKARRIK